MNRPSSVAGIIGIVLLAGCTPHLSEFQVDAIARDAPTVIANYHAPSIIEPSDWPASIAALNPEGVFVSVDGLYIVTTSFLASQWGVFVPCSPKGFSPATGHDPTYTLVANGVYTFHISG